MVSLYLGISRPLTPTHHHLQEQDQPGPTSWAGTRSLLDITLASQTRMCLIWSFLHINSVSLYLSSSTFCVIGHWPEAAHPHNFVEILKNQISSITLTKNLKQPVHNNYNYPDASPTTLKSFWCSNHETNSTFLMSSLINNPSADFNIMFVSGPTWLDTCPSRADSWWQWAIFGSMVSFQISPKIYSKTPNQ